MLENIKERVYKANLDLVKHGLVLFTWGNVSERDPNSGYIVIKPSGVDYDLMKAEDMVVLTLEGKIVEGKLKPSSDADTHLEIYSKHPEIGGIAHTHSTYATSYAQAGEDLTAYGTTHADYFYGDVCCTRELKREEIENQYEINTGKVINETLEENALKIPAVLVKNHGPFCFGKDAFQAVYHSVVLEEIAKMNYLTKTIDSNVIRVNQFLLDKHYNRKHGKNSYYGQGEKK